MSKPGKAWHTIKVSAETYTSLLQVVGEVNAKGWQHLGVKRNDTPTISNIVAEGIGRLRNGKKNGKK